MWNKIPYLFDGACANYTLIQLYLFNFHVLLSV